MSSQGVGYVMGRSDHERRRLELQGSILNPLTDRFLRSGLSAGMRVLDVGCGVGDVSLIAARIVGPRGSVTGIDSDSAGLEVGAARANEENLSQIKFEQAAFETYTTDRLYDAIVGRHILIHSTDPLGWIRNVKSLLRSGGTAAFQEYDLSYFPPMEPELPLFTETREYLVEFFRRAVAYGDVGPRLYHWMQVAEFSNTRSSAECLMSSGVESPFYEWFAETIRSVSPLLESLGIVSAAALDVDTLATRLREEAVASAGCITTPLIVSCCAERD